MNRNFAVTRGENMVKLLILADDFTGALDTGVQFAACGIPTRVVVRDNFLHRMNFQKL